MRTEPIPMYDLRWKRATMASLGLAMMLATTVDAQNSRPQSSMIGSLLSGLTEEETERFRAGKEAFEFELADEHGVGPVFNGRSCVSCHFGPATGGGSPIFGIRFGRLTNSGYDDLRSLGGPTIQAFGIGMVGETNFVGEFVPPEANVVALRRATPTFGLGLVDAVPDSTFVRLATQQRQRNPGVAGRPNFVVNLRTGTLSVGRFGWKSSVATLFDFAADAYKDELGVTTAGFTLPEQPGVLFPYARSTDGRSVSEENPPQGNEALLEANPVESPNLPDDENVRKFTDFMTLLAPPPRGPASNETLRGQALFERIGCADCHTPTLRTGPSEIRALDRVNFMPYSDFLLHDMGTLGDGIGGPGSTLSAKGSEMRTAPLWGLRFQDVYLHDGRARTLDQAIRLHDGQGTPSKNAYTRLPEVSRRQIQEFLKSL